MARLRGSAWVAGGERVDVRMDVGRMVLLALARLVELLLPVTPRLQHAYLAAWPSDEGNAVETAAALVARRQGRLVWADAPEPGRLRELGIDAARVRAVRKNSFRGIWSFLTADVRFFTHGVYGCPRSPRSKPMVNLWHGDGPKATTGARVHSTYLVSSSRVLAQSRLQHFRVSPDRLLLAGLPRIEQLRRPSSPEQLRALGLDPGGPFAVWMPTYRQAGGAGLDGSFVDTTDVAADATIAQAITPGLAELRRLGIQIAVKPHPLDPVSRDDPSLISITDEGIRRAGTTLYQVLGASAGLLTDYSSVWTDYLALDRPIGFFMPDLEGYLAGRGVEPPDAMDHLPGVRLVTPEDFSTLGEEMLGDGPGPGRRLREQAVRHFGLVHPPRPAELLLRLLEERGALRAMTDQEG